MKEILLLAPANDIHANVVAEHIAERARVSYVDLQAAVEKPLNIAPGQFVRSDAVKVATPASTIWWRRTGYIPPDSRMSHAENRLRVEEARAQLVGGLLSLNPRWIDHPGAVETAEHTLLQLAVAKEVGALTPRTKVTNEPDVARDLSTRHRLIAKSISSGVGIRPYADDVDDQVIDLLPNAPTLLQEHVHGTADLRVIVVANSAHVWRRPRQPGQPFDWRRPDPHGTEFVAISNEAVAGAAVRITHRLGLTFSAQDWVETAQGNVFLEANPVGQWLFLAGAEDVIGEALAEHLLSGGPHA